MFAGNSRQSMSVVRPSCWFRRNPEDQQRIQTSSISISYCLRRAGSLSVGMPHDLLKHSLGIGAVVQIRMPSLRLFKYAFFTSAGVALFYSKEVVVNTWVSRGHKVRANMYGPWITPANICAFISIEWPKGETKFLKAFAAIGTKRRRIGTKFEISLNYYTRTSWREWTSFPIQPPHLFAMPRWYLVHNRKCREYMPTFILYEENEKMGL